jgi:leader peptidase (prepilin peptidase) / N-methyltransferase
MLSSWFQTEPFLWVVLVGVVSLFVGSFLNVVIYRLPKMMEADWHAQCAELNGLELTSTPTFNLAVPRSRCSSCGHSITALENIPVVSFIFLRGKCSACGQKFGLRYPLIELLTAALAAIVAAHFGANPQGIAAVVFVYFLISMSFIDIDTQLLPDDLTLGLMWLGLLLNTQAVFTSLENAIFGAALGYGILWLVFWLFKIATGKEGMGYGDFKLLAALGAWMGWQTIPSIILLSSVSGALIGIGLIISKRLGRDIPMPFGPYLACAGFISLLYNKPISNWLYQGLF